MFAIMIGNPIDGLEFIGPFTTQMAAAKWLNNDAHIDDGDGRLIQLQFSGDTLDYVDGPVPEPKL